jgi:acetyl-CoA carboxylase biotin carboxyl carrier protein
MNLKDIKELIDILKDSDVSEFELERTGTRIHIRKGGDSREVVLVDSSRQSPPSSLPLPVQAAAPAPAAPAAQAVPSAEAPDSRVVVVNSPIVGTFYRSPTPDSPAYIEVGDVVKKGQVLCVIEAMKLMNEIEAEVSGKVVKIVPDNAQPVEYAEPLFHIEPA